MTATLAQLSTAAPAAWALPLAAAATATACAALSPLVVARRWAFVGEGVSHSGYGGAGVVWLLSLLFPHNALLRGPGGVTLGVALFGVLAALAIGKLARGRATGALGFDAATGIFLTASLAFGFLARSVYESATGALPVEATSLLFGDVRTVAADQALLTATVAAAVVAGLWLCGKEVLAYAFDPELAEVGGVPAAAVHYGLLVAMALVVVVAAKLVGVVLVTALLVLPGATAALLGGGLGRVYAGSFVAALLAVAAALAAQAWVRSSSGTPLPLGPVVVLVLVAQFLLAWGAARLRSH